MKIDYPIIKREDIRPGDIILTQWVEGDHLVSYREEKVHYPSLLLSHTDAITIYYLIDRPRPIFPEDYGSVIIAKKVRGIEFPEGIPLARQRGSNFQYAHTKPLWKSFTEKIIGYDNHGENHIEDWILAKVVPA